SRSRQTASASVAPNESVIRTHVSQGRKRKRAAAARKSAKNIKSGRPRFAPLRSPGIGKAKEKSEKTCACFVTITFVGPRQTEYASTQGMISATRTTQLSASKYERKAKPTAVMPKSLEKFSAVFQPATWKAQARTPKAAPAASRPRPRCSGSTSHTSPKHAGITTSETNAMSHHVDAFHSRSWRA